MACEIKRKRERETSENLHHHYVAFPTAGRDRGVDPRFFHMVMYVPPLNPTIDSISKNNNNNLKIYL